jgi:hypothetical protein
MAAFPVMSVPAHVLELAHSVPSVGDSVWLVAQVRSGAAPDVLLHKAIVVSSDRTFLRFAYDNGALNLRATSGAPVVNSAGQVVGINFGGQQEGHWLVGDAVGLGAIQDGLSNIQ